MRNASGAALVALAALAGGGLAHGETVDAIPVATVAEAPGATPGPEPAAGSRQIREIIVTAQKTAQNIQYVPVSISVIDAQFVQEAGLSGLEQISRFTPNVNFDENDVANVAIAMRGFGTPPLGAGLEPSVGLVVDDVPYGRSTYAQDAVFDIDRLEVLRGPQGTLFGKNTIAGVLNFATVAPSMTPGGYLTATLEEPIEGRRIEGGYTLPLVDDVLAARVAVRYGRNDIGIRNTTRDETNYKKDLAARVRFLWHAADELDLSASALYSHVKDVGISNQVTKSTDRAAEVFRSYDPDFESDPYDRHSQINAPTYQERSVEAYALKGEWSPAVDGLDRFAFTTIASYSRVETPSLTDAEFSPIPLGTASSDGDNPYQQATLEVRASGRLATLFDGDSGLDFVGGLFGQRSRQVSRLLFNADDNYTISYFAAGAQLAPSQVTALVPLFPPEAAALIDQALGPLSAPGELAALLNTLSQLQLFPPGVSTEAFVAQSIARSKSASAFGQFTWHASEQLDVTAGARVDHADEKAADYSERLGGSGIATLLVGQRSYDFPDLHKKKTNVAPKVALGYNWTDDVTTFASWARGFKSGVFDTSPLDPGHIDIAPEKATSVEAGVKSKWLDRSLNVNATVFTTDLKNLQVRTFSGVTFVTQNAPRSRSRGLELDAYWLPPLEGLSIAGSAGFLDAKYRRFEDGPKTAGSDAPHTNLTGRRLAYAPKVTATLSPSYRFGLSPAWGLAGLAGVDVLYRGNRYLDVNDDPNKYQRGTTTLNARIGVLSAAGTWSAILNARNVTGTHDRVIIIDQPLLPGNYMANSMIPEPIYSLQLRYDFGGA